MNIYEYSLEQFFFIALFPTAIFLAAIVFLAHWIFRSKKKTTPRVAAQDYLDSPLHAQVVAGGILIEQAAQRLSEVSRFLREGSTSSSSEHLFLNTFVFGRDGLKVSFMTKASHASIGIIYVPERQGLAQKVAHILASQFHLKVILRCKDGLEKDQVFLADQNEVVSKTSWWIRGNLSGIG